MKKETFSVKLNKKTRSNIMLIHKTQKLHYDEIFEKMIDLYAKKYKFEDLINQNDLSQKNDFTK